LILITGEHASCPKGSQKVATKNGLTGDLSQGAGGEYVWLCFHTGEDGITDLATVVSSGARDDCGLSSDWHRVEQESGSNGDLNQGAGGEYIYLCYKKEQSKNALASLELKEGKCGNDWIPTSTFHGSDGSTNQGTEGGKRIFICARRN